MELSTDRLEPSGADDPRIFTHVPYGGLTAKGTALDKIKRSNNIACGGLVDAGSAVVKSRYVKTATGGAVVRGTAVVFMA